MNRFVSRPPASAFLLAGALLCVSSPRLQSQEPSATGLEVRGVPAINFDSDEGFGYGVIAELYHYGDGGYAPYKWTVQPTVFLTTEGRRDGYVFFDAPHLLGEGWRLGGFAGYERQIATPYYGVGNASEYDPALERDDGPDPYWYRFGRTRTSATVTLHRQLSETPLHLLFGGGVEHTTVTPVPKGEGTTLYAADVSAEEMKLWSNFVRGGVVWDTRDRETGPRRGAWTELLVWWVDESFGADFGAVRWTFTDRRYFPLTDRLVFAHRWAVQSVGSGAPVHELFRLQTSFKQQEGLGGAKTVRGVLRNRFVGRSTLVWNAELRWRVADFAVLGRAFHATLTAYVDQGRVWDAGLRVDQLLSDLHRGYGGGIRLGMGENFVVAFDAGTSAETGVPIYIGLGYLY